MCRSLFLISLKVCNFIKKRLQHRCFPVKFAKFLRTPFFTEHMRGLFLKSLHDEDLLSLEHVLLNREKQT